MCKDNENVTAQIYKMKARNWLIASILLAIPALAVSNQTGIIFALFCAIAFVGYLGNYASYKNETWRRTWNLNYFFKLMTKRRNVKK